MARKLPRFPPTGTALLGRASRARGALGPLRRRGKTLGRVSVSLALLVSVSAFAGTYTATNSTDWTVPPNAGTDVDTAGNDLNVAGTPLTLPDAATRYDVDNWVRKVYDGVDFEAAVDKTDQDVFTSGDRCLRDSDNAGLDGPLVTINGHETRTGPAVERIGPTDYYATLPQGNVLTPTNPTAIDFVESIRFTTLGSHIAASSYDVIFHYAGGVPDEIVNVPIALDTLVARAASGADWDSVPLGVALTHNTTGTFDADGVGGTDCTGGQGDEVTVFNPLQNEIVTGIEFDYVGFGDTGDATAWLGGPLSLTIVTDEPAMDGVWDYRAHWASSFATASSPKTNPVLVNAFWHQISWTASNLTGLNEIDVTISCGDDDNANNTLAAGELSTPFTLSLRGLSNPYNFTAGQICEGRYLHYEVDVFDAANNDPQLDDITFTYAEDADGDHYSDAGIGSLNDCNDANPAINPGATENPGDGVESNCDSVENCYLDADDDGARSATVVTGGANGDADCTDPNEGLVGDPNPDCNDGNSAIRPGIAEVAGNNVDNNCDGVEDCYDDLDDDGTRAGGVNTGGANGDADCSDPTEALSSDPSGDCNDLDAAVEPGIPEVVGNNVDNNCDNIEDCYVDGDDDNVRSTVVDTGGTNNDADCNDANEGRDTDLVGGLNDCNDSDATIKPGIAEVVGNNVDNNCDGVEDCYDDIDDDGVRSNNNTTNVGGANGDADCNDPDEAVTGDTFGGVLDCNDADASIEPGIAEVVGNNVDNNCDNIEDCYDDIDDDGIRSNNNTTNVGGANNDADCNDADEAVTGDTFGGVLDCADTDATITPGAAEITGNNVDNNCDNVEDCYDDVDGDGTGTTNVNIGGVNNDADCNEVGEVLATNPRNDCDDTTAAIEPGIAEVVGNNVDNNCDGIEDCYDDLDDDGTRSNNNTTNVGGTNNDADCNDQFEALTGDTFGGILDCNDTTAAIEPGIAEVVGNNVDNNCDLVEDCYTDDDDDGTGTNVTNVGGSNNDGDCNDAMEALATDALNDCNDTTSAVEPGIPEVVGNNVDNNCDNVEDCYDDLDDDGTRSSNGTTNVGGANNDADCNDLTEAVTGDTAGGLLDCVDTDAAIEPGITEVIGNNVDNNCDLVEDCYDDLDDDGTRSSDNARNVGGANNDADCNDGTEALATDTVGGVLDCNDLTTAVEPGIPEVAGNNVDNNCDNVEDCYTDADNDGIRSEASPGVDTGGVNNDADCNDNGEALFNDTFGGQLDCNDAVNTTYPGAPLDECGDGVDDNCNDAPDSGFAGATVDDDDGDGIDYVDEVGYGTSDCDTDSDNDGLTDDVEVYDLSTDPTRTDTDNDGMRDDVEVGANPNNPSNTDGDAFIDALDNDDDGDGLLSRLEDVDGDGNPRDDDQDGDGIFNPLDRDDDGDTVNTDLEDTNNNGNWSDDQDSDGTPNWRDNDDDGDGIRTQFEMPITLNTDGDGLRNWLDSDDDGDTVLTANENIDGMGDARTDDTNGDGEANYLDTDDDGDGISTANEYADAPNRNVDNDADQNHVDLDSDGDGYNDQVEGRVDSDADGTYDYLDLDSDGDRVVDASEVNVDSDSDGTRDRLDIDDDQDGINTSREYQDSLTTPDPDGDGVASWLDGDSDDDSWSDDHENATDEDGDSVPSYLDMDSDADLLPDELELHAPLDDTDGDGIENRIDADDDGDCVATRRELGPPATPSDQDLDRTPNYLDPDDDDDSLVSCDENPCGNPDPYNCNTDGDALADFLDPDDDDDGIPTDFELSEADGDADGDPNHLDLDSDDDGFLDEEEDPDGDLQNTDTDPAPDFVDIDSDADRVLDIDELHADTDGDGAGDRIDADDDGDSLPTIDECGFPRACDNDPRNDDTDGDRVANYLDNDDDGDGILTRTDDFDRDGRATTGDTDGDLTPDWADTDDDNDTVPTLEERREDIDGDGLQNHRDPDDDGDSFLTAEELDPNNPGSPLDFDFDGDGLENFRDADDDDDGKNTICEETWIPSEDFDYHLNPDSDDDGYTDGEEWPEVWGEIDPAGCVTQPADTNDDGIFDVLDDDDDGDGVLTINENNGYDNDRDCLPIDVDGDGTIEAGEVDPSVRAGDGVPDHRDLDSDGDALQDGAADPIALDSDSDGVFDKNDCDNSGCDGDTDGDGLSNRQETQVCCLLKQTGYDIDFNGEADASCVITGEQCGCILTDRRDSDFDGVIDALDVGQVTAPRDTDGDGIGDVLDTDDDGDGLDTLAENLWWLQLDCALHQWDGSQTYAESLDCVELRPKYDLVLREWGYTCDGSEELVFFCDDTESTYSNVDAPDAGSVRNPDALAAGAAERDDFNPPARDPDGVPNFLDADDDGDGVPTLDERNLANDDVDGDGWVNWYDRADEDGPDADADGDGLVNGLEADWGFDPFSDDSDGDGVPDALEFGDQASPQDSDGDRTPDGLDTDDDNDGVLTALERQSDTDGDGEADYLDPDSDDDGTEDGDEVGLDADCDGVSDAVDTANDGLCDSSESALTHKRQGCACESGPASLPTPWILSLVVAGIAVRRRRANS